MPFLNSLVDPYGVLARGTYGEDEEEEQRLGQRVSARQAPPAAPPSGDGGGGGPGPGFLAHLLMSAPMLARIGAGNTNEDIQRALADQTSMLERFAENRQLQLERQRERTFAAEENARDRTARTEERQADRDFRSDLLDREQEAAVARDERRVAANTLATQEDREYRERITAQENANNFRKSMVGAVQFAGVSGAQVDQWAQEYEQTGEIPPAALEAQARAQRAEDAANRAFQLARSQDRQPTELELRQAYSQQQYEDLLAEYKAIPSDAKLNLTPQQFMQQQLGAQGYEMMQAGRLGYELTPQAPPSEAEATERILNNPTDPDHRALITSLDEMTAGEFDARVKQLADQAPDREAFLEKLERSITNPDHKSVLRRLRGERPTRASNYLDIAGATIAGAATDVSDFLVNSPFGAPGRASQSLLNWLNEKQ